MHRPSTLLATITLASALTVCASPALAVFCPKGTGDSADLCVAASAGPQKNATWTVNNTFGVSFSAHARQSRQTWANDSPWGWNQAGIDYPIGPYGTLVAANAASAPGNWPAGCVYNTTGAPGTNGPTVKCTSVTGSPVIQNVDFTSPQCTPLIFDGTYGGAITIKNSKFVMGANCIGANTGATLGYLISGSATTLPASLYLESDLFDGQAAAFQAVATNSLISWAPANSSTGAGGGDVTGQWDVFLNPNGRDLSVTIGGGNVAFTAIYAEGCAQGFSTGQHYEFLETVGPQPSPPSDHHNFSHDAMMFGASAPGGCASGQTYVANSQGSANFTGFVDDGLGGGSYDGALGNVMTVTACSNCATYPIHVGSGLLNGTGGSGLSSTGPIQILSAITAWNGTTGVYTITSKFKFASQPINAYPSGFVNSTIDHDIFVTNYSGPFSWYPTGPATVHIAGSPSWCTWGTGTACLRVGTFFADPVDGVGGHADVSPKGALTGYVNNGTASVLGNVMTVLTATGSVSVGDNVVNMAELPPGASVLADGPYDTAHGTTSCNGSRCTGNNSSALGTYALSKSSAMVSSAAPMDTLLPNSFAYTGTLTNMSGCIGASCANGGFSEASGLIATGYSPITNYTISNVFIDATASFSCMAVGSPITNYAATSVTNLADGSAVTGMGLTLNANNSSFNGYISGANLVVTSGTLPLTGQTITGTGVAANSVVLQGANNFYVLSQSSTVGSAGSPVALLGNKPNCVGGMK